MTWREIVQFLLADAENPGSICGSLNAARENARTAARYPAR